MAFSRYAEKSAHGRLRNPSVAHLMFEKLTEVSTLLKAALDDYVDACAKLRGQYFQERAPDKLDELLSRVANELQLIASYGTKLKQSEASMKVVRNSSPTTVPISALPAEILGRIFRIVIDDQPEPLDATRAPSKVSLLFPKYPETLSHVCFGWRQIAIASHELWTRIDLVLHHPLGPGFLARAKNHVERAGRLPIDVHMMDPTLKRDYMFGINEFEDFDFLAVARTPMSSLRLVSYHGLYGEHHNFIRYFIANCAPQTLKQLVIRDGNDCHGSVCFIAPSDQQHDRQSIHTNLSEQSLESFWQSTSILRLSGLYPYWTSPAYHGLVDLRLGSDTMGSVPVSEVQIINILKASPGLRVFHLHLDIADVLPDHVPISTIQLYELESVNLSAFDMDPSQILRHLAPGQKPLQLSVFGGLTDVVEQFLRRSNVTQLRLAFGEDYPLINALYLCPNLRVLVLHARCRMEQASFKNVLGDGGEGTTNTPIRIHSLYILNCEGIGLNDLRKLVEKHSVQELTLWRTFSTIIDEYGSRSRNAYASELSTLCPIVNSLRGRERSPIDDWDLF